MAVTDLPQHLQIEAGSLLEPLSLQQLLLLLELVETPLELIRNGGHGTLEPLSGGYVVGLGKHGDPLGLLERVTTQNIEAADTLDLVAKVGHADTRLLVGWEDLEHISAGAKATRVEIHLRAFVLHVDKRAQGPIHATVVADVEEMKHAVKRLG